jgi:hypothetical protein
MPAPLVTVTLPSIYGKPPAALPKRMARCSPDFAQALLAIQMEVLAAGGRLVLSDMYRTYLMQAQAHMDYVSGKKKAFSPSPGGSMHEAGRAVDIDLGALGVPLASFWVIAARHGVVPIIARARPDVSEAWHFEGRGSHQLVYDYYARKGLHLPARGMATSAILAIGQRHDEVRDPVIGRVQSALVRLGQDPGVIDGIAGAGTRAAADAAGVSLADPAGAVAELERRLALAFPAEYAVAAAEDVAGLEGVVTTASVTIDREPAEGEGILLIDQRPRRRRVARRVRPAPAA